MFLSALQTYVTIILIAVIILQYAFATFCLLKLAYLDIDKKQYILWNLFILIVFFIGGTVFLVYYFKHPEKRIAKLEAPAAEQEQAKGDEPTENADTQATEDPPQNGAPDNE